MEGPWRRAVSCRLCCWVAPSLPTASRPPFPTKLAQPSHQCTSASCSDTRLGLLLQREVGPGELGVHILLEQLHGQKGTGQGYDTCEWRRLRARLCLPCARLPSSPPSQLAPHLQDLVVRDGAGVGEVHDAGQLALQGGRGTQVSSAGWSAHGQGVTVASKQPATGGTTRRTPAPGCAAGAHPLPLHAPSPWPSQCSWAAARAARSWSWGCPRPCRTWGTGSGQEWADRLRGNAGPAWVARSWRRPHPTLCTVRLAGSSPALSQQAPSGACTRVEHPASACVLSPHLMILVMKLRGYTRSPTIGMRTRRVSTLGNSCGGWGGRWEQG